MLNLFLTLPPVYPILDTASLERLNIDPIIAAEGILEGGAQILQYRHKAFWSREIVSQARQIAQLCDQARARFVVNDRSDYAALLNAALHLGQDDLTPQDARVVTGPDAMIGFSTHNPDQLRAAQDAPVDYFAIGPIFTTASKDRPDPTVGIETIRIARTLTRKPLVAIGGITLDNAPLCWEAGADSVAIIAALFPNPCTKAALRDRMTEWLQSSAILHKWPRHHQ
jgi:thiamine-phosphate pyrophosphorylase